MKCEFFDAVMVGGVYRIMTSGNGARYQSTAASRAASVWRGAADDKIEVHVWNANEHEGDGVICDLM